MGWHGVEQSLVALGGDWRQFESQLKKAAARGGHHWSEVERKIATNHAQVWTTPTAALICQMTVDDAYECWIAAGSQWRTWAHEADRIIPKVAKELGATRCRIWGRKGWARVFPHWQRMGMENGLLILERDCG